MSPQEIRHLTEMLDALTARVDAVEAAFSDLGGRKRNTGSDCQITTREDSR